MDLGMGVTQDEGIFPIIFWWESSERLKYFTAGKNRSRHSGNTFQNWICMCESLCGWVGSWLSGLAKPESMERRWLTARQVGWRRPSSLVQSGQVLGAPTWGWVLTCDQFRPWLSKHNCSSIGDFASYLLFWLKSPNSLSMLTTHLPVVEIFLSEITFLNEVLGFIRYWQIAVYVRKSWEKVV